ncbi:hypothetical protein Pan44_44670 [Caulifigura coniformis]|uniref:Uncharacterized protein n=2 Tax=Caulifigura coniformis TaxID=2527983 RepID=A0A517SJW0_9PLAN|nr:hypothetical protein Pan44_44670 [Caulifigura coniformis]
MAGTLASARISLALALVAGFTARSIADDAKHTLRYRFSPEESVYFTSHNETSRRYLQNVSEIQTNDSVDALKHYKVLSVTPEGGAVLELTIDRTKMSVDNGSSLFIYDSTKDQDPPAAFQVVHGTVGRPWLRVTVNALGETSNYQTPAGTAVPESADFVSRVLPVLPEKPVAIGEIWKEPFTVDAPNGDVEIEPGRPLTRPITMQRVYKLKSVENGIAAIDLRTEVLTSKRTPKEDVFIIQRQYSGSITIDMANGRLLGRELAIDGNVVGYDGPTSAMSVKMAQRDSFAPAGAASAAQPAEAATK